MPLAEETPDESGAPSSEEVRRPWMGLAAFTEKTQHLFFGRDKEVADIFVRVREETLTVLYGKSGLGKTSLLGAGLFPKLRVEGFRPILIRLRFGKGDPPLSSQVENALGKLEEGNANGEQTTLWERFHRRSEQSGTEEEGPIVLIFDQGEELFTLARDEREEEADALFEELGDLIENRPPRSLRLRLEADRKLSREYDFGAAQVRIVFTLREDYLSQLEEWKEKVPSVMRNRMGLHRLNGPQALEAVVRPGAFGGDDLVSREVGELIVRFVAKKPEGTPLEKIGAVPPLLSLVCEQLNEARMDLGLESITDELVDSQSEDILDRFYEDSFREKPRELRWFVEDRMITDGGHRAPVVKDDLVRALSGKTTNSEQAEELIQRLIDRRLISGEDRNGVIWLELTHDVLAPLALQSREQRKARKRLEKAEADRRRFRRLAFVFGLLAAMAVVSVLFAWANARRAAHAEQTASENFQSTLRAADRLAVDNIEKLRWTLDVPTERKRWLANRFDQSFLKLREDVDDREDIRFRHAELLIANAELLFEVGDWRRASIYAKRAEDILFDEDGDPRVGVSGVSIVRAARVMARVEYFLNDAEGLHSWLDVGRSFLSDVEETLPAMERLIFDASITALRINGFTDTMNPQKALQSAEAGLSRLESFAEQVRTRGATSDDEKTLFAYLLQLEVQRVVALNELRSVEYSLLSDSVIALFREVQEEFPDPSDLRVHWWYAYAPDFAIRSATNQGKNESADKHAAESVEVCFQNLKKDPSSPLVRLQLARALFSRLRLHTSFGRTNEGERDIGNALRLLSSARQIAGDHPKLIRSDIKIAYQQSRLLPNTAYREEDETILERLEKCLVEHALHDSDTLGVQYYIPYIQDQYVRQLYRAKDYEKTVRSSLDLIQTLARLENHPVNHNVTESYEFLLVSLHYASLALQYLEDNGKQSSAVAEIERFLQESRLAAPEADSASVFSNLGAFYSANDRPGKAREFFEESLRVCEEQIELGERSSVTLGNMILTSRKLIDLFVEEDKGNDALALTEKLLTLLNSLTFESDEISLVKSRWDELTESLNKVLSVSKAESREEVDLVKLRRGVGEIIASSLSFDESENAEIGPESSVENLQELMLPTELLESDLQLSVPEADVAWASRAMIPAHWRNLGESEIAELVESYQTQNTMDGARILRVREAILPFYEQGRLVESEFLNTNDVLEIRTFLIIGDDSFFPLEGTSPPIHEANALAPLRIEDAASAATYLKFFCAYVAGEQGSFNIIEHASEIPFKDSAPPEHRRQIAKILRPLHVWPDPDKAGDWRATASIHYSNTIFWAEFYLHSAGLVEMLDDTPIGVELPIESPFLSSRVSRQDLERGIDLDVFGIEADDTLPDNLPRLDEALAELETALENQSQSEESDGAAEMVSQLKTAAFACLLEGEFNRAESFSRRALTLMQQEDALQDVEAVASLKNDIHRKLAVALIFQDRFAEASQIYGEFWTEEIGDSTFGDDVLEELALFERIGLYHPDFESVELKVPAAD